MRRYRICCLNSQGHIASEHQIECRGDIDALDEGEKLCANNALEIWEGARLVARVKPGNAPLSHEDRQSL